MWRLLFWACLAMFPAWSAPKSSAKLAAGKKQMLAACQGCHPLQTIELRRFSREDWDSVLRKMTSMGAKVKDREALLEYLAATYKP